MSRSRISSVVQNACSSVDSGSRPLRRVLFYKGSWPVSAATRPLFQHLWAVVPRAVDLGIRFAHFHLLRVERPKQVEGKLDGTEQDQQMPGAFPGTPPTTVRASGEWQGGTLYIQKRGQMHGGAMTLHERYFLSDDGSQLIELVERHGITGDKEQRLVFQKD